MKNKKQTKGKIIRGKTAEERFKEIHGMTIQEWNAKREEEFKAKTGMTVDEWYVNQVKTTTPFEFLKDPKGTIAEEDVNLIKDLQELGLKDEVIIVLLHYVMVISKIGLVHSLVKEMGKSWHENNLTNVEDAVIFIREEQKKYKGSENNYQ
ncbi:DnaD domain protein [Bacillus sp. EB01]|uniref:DnaD domain protein n=1 Tax=Bacillus sp. EB01 TaxID=1347086 RepID=UPI0005C5E855|nr:DnaD domain protein [Bacillus sp. EB01]